ncbi:MAG TPA: hypothetical protein GX008_10950 [Firmicutes bacterium]|jgi:hypothetical protein|nr:MAG: hypothetical protein AA931_10545 [Peptococcaceae bacterium 1109]HHT74215.1 hypothetical protein [Bacillota bacterium]
MSKSIGRFFSGLYQVGAVKRTIIIWLLLQAVLWVFFVIGYLARPGAWQDVPAIAPASAAVGGVASTLGYIVFRNAIVLLLIGAGNILVRFGSVTPGLLVLLVQGATIGWVAGTNGFEVPFPSIAAANLQYLRIGLWETSAYAVFCGLTLTKSLLVADGFPAKEWVEKHTLSSLKFSRVERILALLTLLFLVGAALVEALYLAK